MSSTGSSFLTRWCHTGWLFVGLISAMAQPASLRTPPLPPSPVQQFREWLALGAEAREKAVSDWPLEKRKVLLAKLRTYESLPADEREKRLQMLDLHWYLRPLMGMKLDERTNTLALVPPALQPIVYERLRHWDSLKPELRRQILEDDNARELVTKYYLALQEGRSKEQIRFVLTPEKRAELDQALKSWKSPASRSRTAQLTTFFQLSRDEQSRTVQQLSESERQDIEKTLDTFSKLSPEQRRVCVESFQKFTMMPPPERASFLRNAARWQVMTPEERATWKGLVTKFPPLPSPPLPQPPMPDAPRTKNRVADLKEQ